MKVSIEAYTPNPCEVISKAAGICYNKKDFSMKRLERCYKNGHLSVFEHASVTFRIEGISRACSHQLVRHRMASYCQQSQRYAKVDTGKNDWYVTPPRMMNVGGYKDHMRECAKTYESAIDCGIKPEDARYMLPEATKTEIFVTMNFRELFHFLDLRTDSHAQWEIRDMAWKMVEECRENEEIAPLIALWDGKCDIMSPGD